MFIFTLILLTFFVAYKLLLNYTMDLMSSSHRMAMDVSEFSSVHAVGAQILCSLWKVLVIIIIIS